MKEKTTIYQTARNIGAIVHHLLENGPMVRGSFSIVHRKCGKQTCWCAKADAKGHPYARVTWKEDGRTRMKAISEEDLECVRKMAENYRKFRSLRRQLRIEEDRMETQLNEYEKGLPR